MGHELCYNKAILYKRVCLLSLMAGQWCCKYCSGEAKTQNTWLWFGKDRVLGDPTPCFRYLVFRHIHVMWQRFDPYWQTYTDWNCADVCLKYFFFFFGFKLSWRLIRNIKTQTQLEDAVSCLLSHLSLSPPHVRFSSYTVTCMLKEHIVFYCFVVQL